MIEALKEQFTDEEQSWFVANMYIYLYYHPTNEFPIDLDDVYSMIGFANKGNAKRTLENNLKTTNRLFSLRRKTQKVEGLRNK